MTLLKLLKNVKPTPIGVAGVALNLSKNIKGLTKTLEMKICRNNWRNPFFGVRTCKF